jgi:antirestriction protein ArdC
LSIFIQFFSFFSGKPIKLFSPYNGKGFTLYNGINQINLSMDLVQKQSADPRYYTFKQIKDLDLKLKKGSKNNLSTSSC